MLKEYQSRKRYPSDLTDEQWTLVEPLLPAKPRQRGGRPRQVDMREVLQHDSVSPSEWVSMGYAARAPPQEYCL